MLDESVIYAMILLVLFIAGFYFISTFYLNKEKYDLTQSVTNKSRTSTQLKRIVESCPNGMCAMDTTSGTKRCPRLPSDSIIYDVAFEVCTYPDACPKNLPYAVNADGSVNLNGKCSEGTVCRCSNKATCANNVVTKMVVKNGYPDGGIFQSDNYFIQPEISEDPHGAFNQLLLDDISKEFCSISNQSEMK